MAVYNGQSYLRETIESILNQTFKDFEFLIIDDGSTDQSATIIHEFRDVRIKYVSNEKNKGLPFSLNRGLELAQGEYIVRMDADDISVPSRLKKEVRFMDTHPEITACGSWIKTIGHDAGYVHKYLTSPEDIKASLLFNTSMAHPTVILRKSDLLKYNLHYNTNFSYYEEDYDLWVKISQHKKLANIPSVLLFYRLHQKSVTYVNVEKRKAGVSYIRKEQLKKLGLSPSENEMRIHNSLVPDKGESVLSFMEKESVWFIKILSANKKIPVYRTGSLNKVLFNRWRTIAGLNAKNGLFVWKKFYTSPLFKIGGPKKYFDSFKIFVKCVLKK